MLQELSRVEQLCVHRRYKEAELIMERLISAYPDNSLVLSLYGEIKLVLGKTAEAEEAINVAIGISPHNARMYYIKSRIALETEQIDIAEMNLRNAIQIDPVNADYFGALAYINIFRKNNEEALKYADTALAIDPQHIQSLNIRSRALLKLNRVEESNKTLEGALTEDPQNAATHATFGWNLLENGDHKQALEHFSEALQINPNLKLAQAGLLEAMKARYIIYRLFMKYSFWMSNMASKNQWVFIIGFYLVYRLINSISQRNEALQPFLIPILILMGLMAFSTWIMTPLSNLFLRLNVYGRNLLDENEINSSNYVGMSAIIFLFGIFIYLFGAGDKWLVLAGFGLTMMIPLSVLFTPTKKKNILPLYTLGLAVIGTMAVFKAFSSEAVLSGYITVYVLALFAFQWIVNLLVSK